MAFGAVLRGGKWMFNGVENIVSYFERVPVCCSATNLDEIMDDVVLRRAMHSEERIE